MKSKTRRYATFTTETDGRRISRELSYWQVMFRFALLPALLAGIIIFLVQLFFQVK